MNIPAGASDVINPPQPTDPASALGAMQRMREDPAVMERVRQGDPAVFAEYNKAWRVSRGLSPEPQPAINNDDVFKESNARALRETETRPICCAPMVLRMRVSTKS